MKARFKTLFSNTVTANLSITLPKIVVKTILLVLIITAILLSANFSARAIIDNDWDDIGRDFLVAMVAHKRAGNPIPFEADYTHNLAYDVYETFGVETNSMWMLDQALDIIPYFAYEGVSPNPLYPVVLGWGHMPGQSSFHIMGWAYSAEGMVFLNERIVKGDRWSDARRVYSTLTHELIHIQMGAFGTGGSESLESATSAATLEVLAAMCNYESEIACAAFWYNVENFARASLWVGLNDKGMLNVYDFLADMFFRTSSESRSSEKGMRYWANDMEQLEGIQERYGKAPWVNHITPGLCGKPFNTEIPYLNDGLRLIRHFVFDDAQYLLGRLNYLIRDCGWRGS